MFVLCAVLTLTIVLSFARAASLTRETGGVIIYASHAFGPFIGFQTGWLAWLSRVAAMAANTNLLVTYLRLVLGTAGPGALAQPGAGADHRRADLD